VPVLLENVYCQFILFFIIPCKSIYGNREKFFEKNIPATNQLINESVVTIDRMLTPSITNRKAIRKFNQAAWQDTDET
jgi:hypothetical protein